MFYNQSKKTARLDENGNISEKLFELSWDIICVRTFWFVKMGSDRTGIKWVIYGRQAK